MEPGICSDCSRERLDGVRNYVQIVAEKVRWRQEFVQIVAEKVRWS